HLETAEQIQGFTRLVVRTVPARRAAGEVPSCDGLYLPDRARRCEGAARARGPGRLLLFPWAGQLQGLSLGQSPVVKYPSEIRDRRRWRRQADAAGGAARSRARLQERQP